MILEEANQNAAKEQRKHNLVQQKKPDIKEYFQATDKWDTANNKSKRVDRLIAEMIVMDELSFMHVENIGFMRLMAEVAPQYKLRQRKFYSSIVCDEIYERVFIKTKQIINEMKQHNKFAFTTDIWSDSVSGVSLLSLTLHTINLEFDRINLVLGAIPLEERHTGEYISRKFDEMLEKWKIERTYVHCVMRDSGTNMKKALFLSGINNLDCTIHKLHLTVKSGLDSKEEIKEVISKCRNIGSHFHHSTMAQEELKKLQDRLKKPILKVIRDTPTRWNSTLHMLKRTEELKESLCLYAASKSKIPFLSNLEWMILSGCVKVLEPYEEITKKLSDSSSTIADVVPLVASLKNILEEDEFVEPSGISEQSEDSLQEDYEKVKQVIRFMVQTLRAELDRRFKGLENDDMYTVATYLDPRYKGKFFSASHITDLVKLSVARLCDDMKTKNNSLEMIESPVKKGDNFPPNLAVVKAVH